MKMAILQTCVVVIWVVMCSVHCFPSKQNNNVINMDTKLDTTKYKDCHEVHQSGYTQSGTYEIWINGEYPLKVHCEISLNASATVIQRREYGDYSFQQPYATYAAGFGHMPPMRGDFWIGLNHINYLTNIAGNTVLTVVIQDFNNVVSQATFHNFRVMDASQGYRMYIGGKITGNLADDLSYNNGMAFATQDRPDVNHCASNQQAGWWFNYCSYALPNGNYYFGGRYQPVSGFYNGIYWKDWLGYDYSAKFISLSVSH